MSDYSRAMTVTSEYVQNVFGQFDAHARKIEKAFQVTMILRDDKLKISGEEKNVDIRTRDLRSCPPCPRHPFR